MIVCEEYGRALFTLARENGKTKDFFETLTSLAEIFKKNPAYAKLLDTPAVPTEEKLSLIDRAFGDAEPLILNFIKILCERHAVYQLSGCVGAYKKFYYEACGIEEAVCVTARPLDEKQHTTLRKKLSAITGKRVELRCCVDPALIGGIVLRMEGRQLDASVKARLDAFRKSLADVVV